MAIELIDVEVLGISGVTQQHKGVLHWTDLILDNGAWVPDGSVPYPIMVLEYEGYGGRGEDCSPCTQCTSCMISLNGDRDRCWMWYITDVRSMYYPARNEYYPHMEHLCTACTELLVTNIQEHMVAKNMDEYYKEKEQGVFEL